MYFISKFVNHKITQDEKNFTLNSFSCSFN